MIRGALLASIAGLLGAPALAGAQSLPDFRVDVQALSGPERRAMTPSAWRPGCPVGLSELRRIRALHVGFGGRARWGTLVVHRDAVRAVVPVLRQAYRSRFPIRKMIPIERYGGSDDRSVAADNTSAFNCRFVAGTRRWSQHAFGRAIDINPIENPYVVPGRAVPRRSRAYLDRARVRPGMLVEGGAVVRRFDAAGWGWGGRWRGVKDYQHFSSTGR